MTDQEVGGSVAPPPDGTQAPPSGADGPIVKLLHAPGGGTHAAVVRRVELPQGSVQFASDQNASTGALHWAPFGSAHVQGSQVAGPALSPPLPSNAEALT
jgi:hypothetical protein